MVSSCPAVAVTKASVQESRSSQSSLKPSRVTRCGRGKVQELHFPKTSSTAVHSRNIAFTQNDPLSHLAELGETLARLFSAQIISENKAVASCLGAANTHRTPGLATSCLLFRRKRFLSSFARGHLLPWAVAFPSAVSSSAGSQAISFRNKVLLLVPETCRSSGFWAEIFAQQSQQAPSRDGLCARELSL